MKRIILIKMLSNLLFFLHLNVESLLVNDTCSSLQNSNMFDLGRIKSKLIITYGNDGNVKNPFFLEQTVDPLMCFNFYFIEVKNHFLVNISCGLAVRTYLEVKLYPVVNGNFGDFEIKYENDENEICKDTYDKYVNIVRPDGEHILITVCQDLPYSVSNQKQAVLHANFFNNVNQALKLLNKSEKYITVSNNITNNFCNCDQLKTYLKCQKYRFEYRFWIGAAFILFLIISLIICSIKSIPKKSGTNSLT